MPVRQMDKIWNTGEREYREVFNDQELVFPALGGPDREGTYIVMSRRDRVKFLSQFTAPDPELKNQKDEDPGAKPLKWCVHSEAELMVEGHVCNVCGLSFNTPQELAGHLNSHEGQPVAPKPGEANDTGASVDISKVPA